MSSTISKDLIDQALATGVLKFGSFTLKSGRQSPYFFNAALLSSGALLNTIASAYAEAIIQLFPPSVSSTEEQREPEFDVLFGPAYKGIPFAACTALTLFTKYGVNVGLAYDRKEAKTHGEGGSLVGVPIAGKRVVILDDVMTAGTAMRNVIKLVNEAGGTVVGVVQCLDREEVTGGVEVLGNERSTVQDMEDIVGAGKIKSILKARGFLEWLELNGTEDEVRRMKEYRQKYGVKN